MQIQPVVPVDIFLDHCMSTDFRRSKLCPTPALSSVIPNGDATTSTHGAGSNASTPTEPLAAAPKKYLPPHLRAKVAAGQRHQQVPQPQRPARFSRPTSGSSCASSTTSCSTQQPSPEEAEWRRNEERFEFIKWCGGAFSNVTVVPPVTGLPHQVGWFRTVGVFRCGIASVYIRMNIMKRNFDVWGVT